MIDSMGQNMCQLNWNRSSFTDIPILALPITAIFNALSLSVCFIKNTIGLFMFLQSQ